MKGAKVPRTAPPARSGGNRSNEGESSPISQRNGNAV